MLDGRRHVVGWLAVVALAVHLGAPVVLTADGAVGWPGRGHDRELAARRRHHVARRRARRPVRAAVDRCVLLAATAHEVARWRARAAFPGPRGPARGGSDRPVPDRRPLQLLRLLRAGDDGLVRPGHLRRHAPRTRRGAGVHRGQPAGDVRLPALGRRRLPRHGHARHGADRRSGWTTSTPTRR